MNKTGVPTPQMIEEILPTKERRQAGGYALVECFQSIPCNPCASSCPRGAICLESISDIPRVDYAKCNGCGLCAAICPGLAIFIIDESYSATESLIKLPYEFRPLPSVGDTVTALSREGEPITTATVRAVLNSKAQNRTPLISLSLPHEFVHKARFFRIGESAHHATSNFTACHDDCVNLENLESLEGISDSALVCRCEEITIARVRELISEGFTTLDEIKRISRAGMGACQGRTCRNLILGELNRLTNTKPHKQPLTTFRPTAAPVRMKYIVEEDANENI